MTLYILNKKDDLVYVFSLQRGGDDMSILATNDGLFLLKLLIYLLFCLLIDHRITIR